MKVTLMTPPYHCGVVESAGRWLPLPLLYLAQGVRQAGHDPEIYDAMTLGHGLEEINSRLKASAPEVLGVSAITASLPASLEVLELAKRLPKPPVTILGGVHGSFMYREILEAAGSPVDYVVRGEGEETLPELLSCLVQEGDPAKVPGLALRRDGKALPTEPRPFAAKLGRFRPAWDLVDWKDYTYFPLPGSRLGAISTSRGCPHECSFCSQQKVWQRTWRGREPEDVAEELALLRERYGVDVVLLTDEYPTYDSGRWRRMLDLIAERKLDMKFLIETRAGDIVRDRELMDSYAKAGIVHVYVGIESADQDSLDRFKKDLTVAQSREALSLIRDIGAVSETSFVLGMPEETPETVRKTLAAAKEYDPDFAHFLLLAPWPYADLYGEVEPYVETKNLAEYNLVSPVARSKHMSREELRDASVACYREFYMGKLPKWFALKDGFRKDYVLNSMRLILRSSFLKRHMGGLGRIPVEVERYFSMLRV